MRVILLKKTPKGFSFYQSIGGGKFVHSRIEYNPVRAMHLSCKYADLPGTTVKFKAHVRRTLLAQFRNAQVPVKKTPLERAIATGRCFDA